jgi:hypothetical protein
MAYHVEIRSSLHRARAFNMEQDELERTIVRPWLEERPVELGEREWEPRKSSLKILEGPALDATDLAFGQGWSNAERGAENVTHRLIEGASRARQASEAPAFVVESEDPERAVAEMTAGRHASRTVPSEVWERFDSRDPQVAAIILVTRKPGPPGAQGTEAPQNQP